MKIIFTNADMSPMHTTLAWQDEIVRNINADSQWAEKAAAAGAELKSKIDAIAAKAVPELCGVAVIKALQSAPRYAYLKNLEHGGVIYDAEIDLLAHTVSFLEV